MDLIKIGKYIALKRKEKGLTQEQLAECLGISGRSVSKWERGLNMPDIGKLEQLCNVLDVSIVELLGGNSIDIISDNVSFFDIVKYYVGCSKKIYFYVLIILIILVMFLISIMFMISDFNKNKIYSIRSLDSNYEISGYLIVNQEKNILIMNDLNFQGDIVGTSDEPQIKLINIFITYEDKRLMSYTENIEDSKDNKLSYILDNLSFSIEDNKIDDSNIIDYNSDISKIKMEFEYITVDNKSYCIEIKMEFEELFSNNKFIY